MVEEPKALRNCIMMLQSANDFLDRAAISAELAGDKQALREIQRPDHQRRLPHLQARPEAPMTRDIRLSDASREGINITRKKRKSRAGETSPTGNYVRPRESVNRVVGTGRPPEEQPEDHEHEPAHTVNKRVTLPALKCLEKKLIAGEWI